MLALAPLERSAVFIRHRAVAGVRFTRPRQRGIALLVAPVAAMIGGEHAAVVGDADSWRVIAFVKRLLANGPPAPEHCRGPPCGCTRLLHDRDIRDRDAWVRRGIVAAPGRDGGR